MHDLRHTVGMRLREAGIREETIADVLRHSRQGMTTHYSAVQVREIYEALELIKSDANRVNVSYVSLLSLVNRSEIYQNLTGQKKTGQCL